MTTTRFFVYGSMCEGMVHFSKIQSFIESSVPAQIRATAYRLKVGFPALLNEGSDLVPGHLIEIKPSDLLLALLDESLLRFMRLFQRAVKLLVLETKPLQPESHERRQAWRLHPPFLWTRR